MKIAPREKRRNAAGREKNACRLFSRGVIFTRARVSLEDFALAFRFPEEKWGTIHSLIMPMLFSRKSDQLRNSSHKACFQVSNSAGLLQKGMFFLISRFVTLVF